MNMGNKTEHNRTEEELAKAAREGDELAIEELLQRIRRRINNMAVRMLGQCADAEDAAQDILIKIATHIRDFRGESSFSTWSFRIATNHLLNTRKRRTGQQAVSLKVLGPHLLTDKTPSRLDAIEKGLWEEEVKTACMRALLVSVNRDQRAAYILSDIIGVTCKEGAEILDIKPDTFRKRLCRARKSIRDFVRCNCGFADPGYPCRCWGKVKSALGRKRRDPLLTYSRREEEQAVLHGIAKMDRVSRAAHIFRCQPNNQALDSLRRSLNDLLDSSHVPLLN